MLIHLICAARPNFMKIAPLFHALRKESWAQPVIVHTGQHYDINMSDAFFKDLNLPNPDIYLGVGSGTHAEQTAKVMLAYEKILYDNKPDIVVVVGDVNSTMAVAITTSKLGVKLCHIEAGLRSFDRSMPEELNRIITDALSDILFAPSQDAVDNLKKEGIDTDKIYLVGNIMIDTLEMLRPKIESQNAYSSLGLSKKGYAVVTLHRPSNVDNISRLKEICNLLKEISYKLPCIFPVHPRTYKMIKRYNLFPRKATNIHLLEPLSYIKFMNLVFNCSLVITDSGGIQEETTYLGIPCLTLRDNTERPITITHGTNQLCKLEQLIDSVERILQGHIQKKRNIKFWDGKTSYRIAKIFKNQYLE